MVALDELVSRRKPGYSLPAELYLSPEVYRLDLERMVLRHWHCAGHISQIPAAGDWIELAVDIESVIVVHGDDGETRAFANVCRHRGSRICHGAAGHATSSPHRSLRTHCLCSGDTFTTFERSSPMFGRHKMTHEGTATVISCSDAAHSMMWTTGGHKYSKYDLVLDVRPIGGSIFRAAAEASFAIFMAPTPGEQLKVRCNPERQLVEVDIDGDPRFNMKLHDQSAKEQREAQYERDLAAPPGTPPAASSAPPPGAGADSNLDPELQELMRLEEQERRGGGSGPSS